MLNKAKMFIRTTFTRGAFVGLHLRNGIDWVCGICYIYNFFYIENVDTTNVLYREY